MTDETWSYEKWVERIGCSATDNDLYRIVDKIYDQGHHDGYCSGFGDGKVCCGGSCCACGDGDA